MCDHIVTMRDTLMLPLRQALKFKLNPTRKAIFKSYESQAYTLKFPGTVTEQLVSFVMHSFLLYESPKTL